MDASNEGEARSVDWRYHLAACALLLVVAIVRWREPLFDARLGIDEIDYTGAFSRVAAGQDPYDIPRFLYPPAFAVVGAWAQSAWGGSAVVGLLRLANLLGAVAAIWVPVACSTLGRRMRIAVALILVALWAPLHQGLDSGNISLAVIGAGLVALAAAARRPALAGLVLGAGLVVKPVFPAAVGLLPAWLVATGSRPASRRSGVIAASAAVCVALAFTLTLGRDLLPRMLAKAGGHLPPGHTVSLWRLLHCLGIDALPGTLLLLALAATLPWLWRTPRSPRDFQVIACTSVLYSLPLVWTHTLALSLPAQLLAFEHAAAAFRRAREEASAAAARRAVITLALLSALALSIQGSEALVAINDRPLWLQALYLAPPVLAPAIFAIYGLTGRRATSGNRQPVGQ